jgi:predicted RNA methylase
MASPTILDLALPGGLFNATIYGIMAKRSQLTLAIKQFRLQCAQEIAGNIGQSDADYVVELCEQYALRIYLNWLATRYGLTAFETHMQSADNSALTSLEKWFPRDTYPLQSCFGRQTDFGFRDFGFRLLHDLLPADRNSPGDQGLAGGIDDVMGDLCVIGEIYQQSIRSPLQIDDRGQLSILKWKSRSTSSEFYTPPWVVSYCFDQIKGRLAAAKVLDPACGSGNFLLGALCCASMEGVQAADFAASNIFGQDVDPRAVSLCRLSLFLAAHQLGKVKCGKELAEALRRHIVVGDSTTLRAAEQYDLVVTNPPYISYGSRGQQTVSPEQAAIWRALYPESAEYKIRLHSIFQDLCVRAAKPGSDVLMLLPDAYLTGSYYKKLRALLTRETEIVQIAELPADTICEATVGRFCIAHYRKKLHPTQQSHPVKVTEISTGGRIQSSIAVPFEVFIDRDRLRFNVAKNPWDIDLLRHLQQFPPLGESLTGHTGIRSRQGQKHIIAFSQVSEKHRRGLVSGAQVLPFSSSWQGHWLNLEKQLLFAGGFDPDIVERPKLLMRQTADRIIAAADTTALYHLNNIHTFAPRKRDSIADLDALATVLNSRLFTYIYRLRSREGKRALAQIDIDMVESMPLPTMNGEAAILARAGQALREAEDPADSFCENVRRAVDCIVYDLYHLPGELIAHIDDQDNSNYIGGSDILASSQARELILSLETDKE